jgi:hypothetical protein
MVHMLHMRRDTTIRLCSHENAIDQKEDRMSVTAHLEELKKKHQTLSDQVDMVQRSPAADTTQVAAMKKQKLKLKEEITRLSG